MAQELPPVDVLVVGMGWTGGIVANELAKAGKKVVGLERGGPRHTEDFQMMHDELRYAQRYAMMQDLTIETTTFRNNPSQKALPIRRYGAFLPGTGVGGAGVHWNGQTWRFLPYDFQIRSKTVERYGAGKIPADMTLQDWGITYDELEPCFDRFEKMAGISGQAGNLKGATQPGGNPFEGLRTSAYPTPPQIVTPSMQKVKTAADKLGYHTFVGPSANLTQEYTNPDGQKIGKCQYCGYCERFGCEWGAKSSPIVTVIPSALATNNLELRTYSYVTSLIYEKKRVTGVRYVNILTGEEVVQRAEVVVLTSYVLNNVRLLLMAGIGKAYDPATGKGVVGKNYCYQASAGATGYFDEEEFNLYAGSGALSLCFDDLNGDNFDHSNLKFLHGGNFSSGQSGRRPIANNPVPPGTPTWGAEFKAASLKYFYRTINVGCQARVLPNRQNFLDLDPTYKDGFGNPLLRMTFDWTDGDRELVAYMGAKAEEVMKETGATTVVANKELQGSFSSVPYQSTHNTGGAIMGSDPTTSVVNSYLQCWTAENLFVVGASAFAHNGGYNPTGTVGALAYRAADGINTYLQTPGLL